MILYYGNNNVPPGTPPNKTKQENFHLKFPTAPHAATTTIHAASRVDHISFCWLVLLCFPGTYFPASLQTCEAHNVPSLLSETCNVSRTESALFTIYNRSAWPSLSPSLSLSLCPSLCPPSLCLSVSLSLCLSFSPSFSLSFSVSHTHGVCLSVCVCVSVCVCLCLSVSVSLSLPSLSVCLPVSLSVFLSPVLHFNASSLLIS